jgi:hypothetical protein
MTTTSGPHRGHGGPAGGRGDGRRRGGVAGDARPAPAGARPLARPEDDDAEAERLRWYYTPTDHGGLPLGQQRPAQQSLAMQLVATGLSRAGYVTVCTVIGWENVLDHLEGWSVDWGRERGRTPASTTCASSAHPAATVPGGGVSAVTTSR